MSHLWDVTEHNQVFLAVSQGVQKWGPGIRTHRGLRHGVC